MERDSFVFYRSFYDVIQDLNAEQTRELVMAICERALNGNEIDVDDKVVKISMNLIRPLLDANTKRYVDGCKGGQHGAKGGRPPKTWDNSQKPQWGKDENPSGSELETPNDNVNDNVNENGNENENGETNKLPANAGRGDIQKKNCGVMDMIHTDDETEDESAELDEAWRAYKEMRKKIKKPLTEYAEKLRAKDLIELGATAQERIAILNQSIASGWQDLYELKEKPKQKQRVSGNLFH